MYHAITPATALAITAGAVGTFYLLATVIPRESALVVGQLAQAGVAFGSAWLLANAGPPGALRTLGLVPARGVFVLAAVLLGVSCWYLDLRAVELLPWWSDGEADDARALTELVRDPSFAATLVTLALVPALCEEVVFRGVLARGLATRMPTVLAAAIAALLFSLYHLSPLQALPTFLLGFALGVLALRARSIVPAMIAHALNNALVIAVTRDDGATGAATWLDDHSHVALAGAGVLAASGLALALVGAPRGA